MKEKLKQKPALSLYMNRIEKAPCLLATEVLIYWCAHTALTIATGIILWIFEYQEGSACYACNTDYNWGPADGYSKPVYNLPIRSDDRSGLTTA
jgi:hypothetical protein